MTELWLPPGSVERMRAAELAKAREMSTGWDVVQTTDLSALAEALTRADLGPGVPITPIHPEIEQPRRWDFPPGYNVPLTPRTYEPLGFAVLRDLAESSDIASICIERNIDDLREMAWEIRPKPVRGMTHADARKRADRLRDAIAQVTGFLQTPDQEHTWGAWLHIYLDELYKTDAACLYLRKTNDGDDLYAIEPVSGDTIAPIINEYGRLPEPPEPAYRQIIRGLSWQMYARDLELPPHQRRYSFDRTILQYAPYWARARSPYGHPPMEWIVLTVNRVLARQTLDLSLYAEGTIPHGFWKVPAEWTARQRADLQDAWDKYVANPKARARLQFMPGGPGLGYEAGFVEPKSESEEWLLLLIFAAYKRSPMKDGFMRPGSSGLMGSARAADQQAEGTNRALMSLWRHVKSQIDRVINGAMGQPELEIVAPALEDAEDSLQRAQERQIYVQSGILSVDEVRPELDFDPVFGDAAGPTNYVQTGQGPVLLSSIFGPPEPATDSSPAVPSAVPGETSDEAPEAAAKAVRYKGDLAKIVYRYLLRSYPPDSIRWVLDPKGHWTYHPHVKLSEINMARRPGGRDPDKVEEIRDTIAVGASMDPVILVDAGSPAGLDIADGWHRTLAARKGGRDDVPAFVGHGFGSHGPWDDEMQRESHEIEKVDPADLERWQRKALRALKREGHAAVRFETTLPPEIGAPIAAALAKAQTPEDVRAAFALHKADKPAGEPERPLAESSAAPELVSSASGPASSSAKAQAWYATWRGA